jgi:DNA-binding HxlR family transcriptional regulator
MNHAEPLYTKRVQQGLKVLSGKWTIFILCSMRDGPTRLSELKRVNPSASKKALTASLRSLEASGIIVRRDLSTSVLHVEYELLETMREPVVAMLDVLAELGTS